MPERALLTALMATGVRIKVCCIGSVEEARLALDAGADAVGLVSAMPSGPGIISEELISAIVDSLPAGTTTFLLTSEVRAERIAAQHGRCRTSTIQLCDALAPGEHAKLRTALPGVQLVQVVHVNGPASFAEAQTAALHADAILLDSGNPRLNVKELGGTGRQHDWAISRAIVSSVRIPVFLAGGLNAENAAAAVESVAPFGLDVCSGVRSQGALDAVKLRGFVAAARSGQSSH